MWLYNGESEAKEDLEEVENKLNTTLGIERSIQTREEIMSDANPQNIKYKHLEVLLDIRELLITLNAKNKE